MHKTKAIRVRSLVDFLVMQVSENYSHQPILTTQKS